VWSNSGGTIFKTTGSEINSLAWIDGNLVAALKDKIWMWSSYQLGPTDPPSHVLDGAVCGDEILAGGSSGDLYTIGTVTGLSVIMKM
jgi:hypothetical protein